LFTLHLPATHHRTSTLYAHACRYTVLPLFRFPCVPLPYTRTGRLPSWAFVFARCVPFAAWPAGVSLFPGSFSRDVTALVGARLYCCLHRVLAHTAVCISLDRFVCRSAAWFYSTSTLVLLYTARLYLPAFPSWTFARFGSVLPFAFRHARFTFRLHQFRWLWFRVRHNAFAHAFALRRLRSFMDVFFGYTLVPPGFYRIHVYCCFFVLQLRIVIPFTFRRAFCYPVGAVATHAFLALALSAAFATCQPEQFAVAAERTFTATPYVSTPFTVLGFAAFYRHHLRFSVQTLPPNFVHSLDFFVLDVQTFLRTLVRAPHVERCSHTFAYGTSCLSCRAACDSFHTFVAAPFFDC